MTKRGRGSNRAWVDQIVFGVTHPRRTPLDFQEPDLQNSFSDPSLVGSMNRPDPARGGVGAHTVHPRNRHQREQGARNHAGDKVLYTTEGLEMGPKAVGDLPTSTARSRGRPTTRNCRSANTGPALSLATPNGVKAPSCWRNCWRGPQRRGIRCLADRDQRG